MTILDERPPSVASVPDSQAPHGEAPLYTRYCAAPRPLNPVGEPSLVHSMLVAMWLGRLIDPLPHSHKKHGELARRN
jgi:hypothetical protein